ncbi:transcriptional regulator with XRE-family HTH domain [Cupriavidus metallidurans]|jgi:transcriptional regulator with XRE-family HTH domain|uniref:helix-turn-helix domain-containing protein n=1 Tax=Cupriavidus TaxID=106589 RepID=UPI00068F98A1|nr:MULTISPECIES: helix-turn-helix transcriptional regulator [Cupriavidus]AVA38112.1 XRE family transcriptional regulator [Cupriavidus metallidurans]MCA3184269.1 helix-turn-helix transcriptional regulator [Cupriavidus sp.]MCA3188648.1 helix-turn-helix transcriptional regulator [Cupriavidus sp.]MCA3234701.1 helix-turn-helix transcriptional regulator [Cupriavidus sp.]MDE4922639.1 helix-turn-helix transcriptional regulator [Cupriavidus metallidurans]
MSINAQSKRSIKILLNLSAGLEETGRTYSDGVVRLNSNIRHAAAAGAAALSQLQGVPLPTVPEKAGAAADARKRVPEAGQVEMPSPVEWLDRLKLAKGFHADVTLAEYLGVSKQHFSQWRTGKASLSVDEAWKVALGLDVDPLLVIASVQFHASQNDKRQVWIDLARTRLVGTSDGATPKADTDRAPGLESKGSKWSPEEDALLKDEVERKVPYVDIAASHRRSVAAILYRLYNVHDLLGDAEMEELCGLHSVRFSPKAVAPAEESSAKPEDPPVAGDRVFI